jgi:hypothetical protein
MKNIKSSTLFAFFIAFAAAFVWLTSARLPARVASHFDGTGVANGFMPHGVYVWFMLAMVVLVPGASVFVTWLAIASPGARINLPNKDYWLVPERRDETIRYLRSGIVFFGAVLVMFLCYVHWLVVLANETQPVRLDNVRFVGGLIVFLAVVVCWLVLFLARFRNPK